MALNDVTFVRGQGGLGRPLAGEDHISGLVMYMANGILPTGFGTSDRIKQVNSIQDAEGLGIIEGSANHAVLWYHINEFFRIHAQGVLYVGLFDDTAIDYSVIETVQNFADGKIRQIGVFDETALGTGSVTTTLQASATTLETEHKPLSVLYAADISGVSDLSTLSDLRALNNKNVSVVIGEDGDSAGAALAVSTGKSVTALGAILGAVSLAKVHENIGFVSKFNFVSGDELDVPAFANGDLVKDTATALLDTLNTEGYIFLLKHVGIAGSYANDAHCAISVSNDFAYIENNRTIDKAVRGIRSFMLPLLNSPLYINEDGTLSEETIALFSNEADRQLEQMERDGEVSAFETAIDPTQDVLTTSKVVISVKIIPVGVARAIEVNIGFTLKL